MTPNLCRSSEKIANTKLSEKELTRAYNKIWSEITLATYFSQNLCYNFMLSPTNNLYLPVLVENPHFNEFNIYQAECLGS